MLCPFLSWKILCCETNGLGAPRKSVLCVWSKSNVVPLHTRNKIEIMWNLCPILISHDVILDLTESGRLFGDSSLVTWCVSIIFDPLVFLYTFFLWSIYEVEKLLHYQLLYFSYRHFVFLARLGMDTWNPFFWSNRKIVITIVVSSISYLMSQ